MLKNNSLIPFISKQDLVSTLVQAILFTDIQGIITGTTITLDIVITTQGLITMNIALIIPIGIITHIQKGIIFIIGINIRKSKELLVV